MKCCELSAGKLRHKLDLRHITRTQGPRGGFVDTETSYAEPKAFAKKVKSTPTVRGGHYQLISILEVFIRYRSDILETDVVYFEGARYKIHKLDDVEFRKRWHKLELEKWPS